MILESMISLTWVSQYRSYKKMGIGSNIEKVYMKWRRKLKLFMKKRSRNL
jgi:hypothetical protein